MLLPAEARGKKEGQTQRAKRDSRVNNIRRHKVNQRRPEKQLHIGQHKGCLEPWQGFCEVAETEIRSDGVTVEGGIVGRLFWILFWIGGCQRHSVCSWTWGEWGLSRVPMGTQLKRGNFVTNQEVCSWQRRTVGLWWKQGPCSFKTGWKTQNV